LPRRMMIRYIASPMVIGATLSMALLATTTQLVAAEATSSAPPVAIRLDGKNSRLTGPAVVILWANWCAPCMAELKRMPALRDAAAPMKVATLALGEPEEAKRFAEAEQLDLGEAFADPDEPDKILARWGSHTLPFAVAIDGQGKVCGRKHGLLGTDQLREWAQKCSK